QVEQETGGELYLAVGNLAYTALDEQPHLDHLEKVCRQVGANIQLLDTSDLRARFPQFRRANRAIFEVDAGFVRASACIEALRVVAERAGATILPERETVSIDLDGPSVAVTTADGARFQGERVVVAAGGWTKRLLPDLADTLTLMQQGILYLAEV